MLTVGSNAVFFNGNIYTLDPRKKKAHAIAIEDGKIVQVGSDAEVKRNASRGSDRTDLKRKTVVPGFIDCHTHFIQMGVDFMNVDLSRTSSLDEALVLIREAAKRIPEGEWVIATGWKESGWKNGRFITKADLDACCPDHPAVAHRVCGHLSSVNSRAISDLCIDAKTPDAECDSSGKLTGILRENAASIPRAATVPDKEMKLMGLALATKKAHSLGVTSVTDNGSIEGTADDFDVYMTAKRNGKLGIRVWFNTPSDNIDQMRALSISTGLGDDWLKLGGLKVFCDGAIGARTAALSKPYDDDPHNTGTLVHERSELDEIVFKANEKDIQLAIHAIGDVGIDTAISALSSALKKHPRRDHRHRIEHLELPSHAHLKKMRELGIIASMQANFVGGEWGYLSRIGPQRASRNDPFREVLDAHVRLVFGSDCMPFSPIYGIQSAVNAPHPAQRISGTEAFAAYTRDAAYASFEEKIKGTLSERKLGDLVVLSADPFLSPESIDSLKVMMTVIGGKVVYGRASGTRKK